jgi:drug/metabolite transporter (DMT)-like permease
VKEYLLVAGNAALLVSGQFLWKYGLQSHPRAFTAAEETARLFLSPQVLGGLAVYGGATVLWLYILSRVPISIAYPLQSFAYVFAVVAAHFLFGESLTVGKVAGSLLIVAGISLIAISSSAELAAG